MSGPHLPEPRALVDLPFPEAKERMLSAFVKEYLLDVLRRADGNVTGLSRATSTG